MGAATSFAFFGVAAVVFLGTLWGEGIGSLGRAAGLLLLHWDGLFEDVSAVATCIAWGEKLVKDHPHMFMVRQGSLTFKFEGICVYTSGKREMTNLTRLGATTTFRLIAYIDEMCHHGRVWTVGARSLEK